MKVLLGVLLILALPAYAQGNKTGFDRDTGQGNLNNENVQENSQGTTEISGPHGQVKQGETDCNNCTSDLPGANR